MKIKTISMRANSIKLIILMFFLLGNNINSFSQVVINEVMHYPSGTQGLIYYNSAYGREYVELYNTSCSPVDVSGYFIACRQEFSGSSGGGFRIPNVPKATIPAHGHLVLGTSASSADVNSVDIQLPDYASNYCQNSPSKNFILANADGWLGLYDAAGVPIDAIYWSSASSKISQVDDYAGVPCTPAGSPGGVTLESAQQINSGFPGVLSYVGNSTSVDNTFSRIPDGGNWQRNIASSINDLTVGNCNGGTCVAAGLFYTPAVVSQPTCGASDGSIVINPNPTGTYVYTWSPNVSSSNSATNLPAGSYTITVDNNGCSKDTTIAISSSSGPNAVASTPTNPSCGASDGQVVIGAVTGGVSPYQYNFNGLGFSATTTYSSLAAGSYSLQVKDANNCVFTASNVVLTGGASPTSIVTTPTNPLCGASDGQVLLGSVTGGVAPYEYNFNNLGYSTSTSFTGLASGSYSLLVKDANNCVYTSSNVVLTSASGPTAILTTPTNPNCGASDGQILLGTVTGGVAPYEYNFNNLGYTTNTSYTNLGAATYTLVVKDANGCTYNATSITLTGTSGGPTAIVVTPTSSTCGSSNGQVNLGVVTGGTAPYQYNFNNQGVSSSTNYTSLAKGNYSIIVVDANNCNYSTQVTVDDIAGPKSFVYSSVNSECSKSTGEIIISSVSGGVLPYEYSISNQSFSNIASFDKLSAGTYNIKVKDNNNCILDSAIVINTIFSISDLVIPNVITVNNDGINEIWSVKGQCIQKFECKILNRWGEIVYTYNDISGSWDGKSEGEILPDGVYFYIINVVYSSNDEKTYQGNISLLNN
jgi:gliding motility-associated-like protein